MGSGIRPQPLLFWRLLLLSFLLLPAIAYDGCLLRSLSFTSTATTTTMTTPNAARTPQLTLNPKPCWFPA